MSSSVNGGKRTASDVLSRLAVQLHDPQDRESYADSVAYVRSLPPNDEFLQVALLFGFLTSIGLQLPDAIAAEQDKMREFLLKAYGDLKHEVEINGSYHEKLNQRLSRLPEEIAAGVKPEAVAKAMGESFRQHIVASGIQESSRAIAEGSKELKSAASEFGAALRPAVSGYKNTAYDIQQSASSITGAADRLRTAAESVDRENAHLLQQVQQLQWWILPLAALVVFVVGTITGALWEQRHLGDKIDSLQSQIAQIQQTLKELPAAIAPPAVKKPKNK